ncbi:MAG: cobalamin biosynthesis protein (CbiG-related)/precorrin-6Y methylase [bacterium]|nr:MAG: cobalamin biosynthesis protein (CbiG-related)/precorrin-6Y methylase [bacterium]
MTKKSGSIYIVGVGPGSPAYLTTQARQIIKKSDVIVGYELSLKAVRELLGKRKVLVQTVENRNEMLDMVARERDKGKNCSILRVGDPCYSSGIQELLGRFKGAQVIPGISSIQVAAARLGLVLEETALLTFHIDGDIETRKSELLNCLRESKIAIVLVGLRFMPKDVADFLIQNGTDPKFPVTIYENLTLEDEGKFTGGLKDVLEKSFTYLSVMIVGK